MKSDKKEHLSCMLSELEGLLEGMIEQQKVKAKKLAQMISPGLTDEDLLNPDNFPTVVKDPDYLYEDGIAAGLLSAKLAIRWFLNERLQSD